MSSERESTDRTMTGRCLCGEVTFETSGAPDKVFVCYCRFCQRLTGGICLVEPIFGCDKVRFRGPPLRTYDYVSPVHGRVLKVHACPECGTRLALSLERSGFKTYGMFGGTFDEPGELRPDRHIFTSAAPPWVVFPSDVNCYAEHSAQPDGTPLVPWQDAGTVPL
ncbi:MAG: GFA family protein [Burkholderiaceae bacterium]